MSRIRRLQTTRTLWQILPSAKASSGDEFARVVNLLLFHNGRRNGTTVTLFDDRAGDWHGLDAAEENGGGLIGYQHKFFPCPLTDKHRSDIEESLKATRAAVRKHKIRLRKWILVTPQDMVESSRRKSGGDVTWFEGLRKHLKLPFDLEHWGHTKLQALFLETPTIGLFYYPELFADGLEQRKTIQDMRIRYDKAFSAQYRDIEFVGMSVYKEQAARTVPMENIYIPLTVIPNDVDENVKDPPRRNPLEFLSPASRHVLLGDPGSGKTTLLRFLALSGRSRALQKRYKAKRDERLPIVVTLRRYADELKKRDNLCLVEYIRENIEADFTLPGVSLAFLEYYLETGRAILLFDGLDELPSPSFKKIVRDRICAMGETYPGNTIVVTSRVYGYQGAFRFNARQFEHHRLAKLSMDEIDQFIRDWYAARLEKARDRQDYISSLAAILRNDEHEAIRELARNPLLLTIIVLVHRIDAVLPDERHVLYQKCTETLLNTWHTWKFHDLDTLHRAKVDRQNVQRMQAIAYWMHHQSGSTKAKDQAVVTYKELHGFLEKHIATEQPANPNYAPADIASAFLEFVQDRAGLLTEVGDRRFSFVHLTFQEYLTAVHIKTLSELNGLKKAWREEIQDHCCDARWREVIRLLVATYGSNDSQEFLVGKILKDASRNQHRARLVAGFLLDGVAPAIAKKNEVVRSLIAATVAANRNDLADTMSALRACVGKYDADSSVVPEAFRLLAAQYNEPESLPRLRLVSIALGRSPEETHDLCGQSDPGESARLSLFFGATQNAPSLQSIEQNMRLAQAAEDVMVVDSPGGTALVALCHAAGLSCSAKALPERAFMLQMMTLACGTRSGPMGHLVANTQLLWTRENTPMEVQWRWALNCLESFWAHGNDRIPARGLDGVLDQALDRALAPNRDAYLALHPERRQPLDRLFRPVQDRARNRFTRMGFHSVLGKESFLSIVREWSVDQILTLLAPPPVGMTLRDQRRGVPVPSRQKILRNMSIAQSQRFAPLWKSVLNVPEVYLRMFCFLGRVFDLQPEGLWHECLRSILLPRIGDRVPLVDPHWWEQVRKSFESGTVSEEHTFGAAWQLVLDGLRYITGYYERPGDSPFSQLADLTRSSDSPELCIANCVRDLSYGNDSRADDLVAMVNSEDPAYRNIFQKCYWRGTAEEEGERIVQERKHKRKRTTLRAK